MSAKPGPEASAGGAQNLLEQDLAAGLAAAGFVHVGAPLTRRLLAPTPASWARFADTWDDLGPDRFMADGGRYRRRRHAVFHVERGVARRQPHQPHYQSRDYNSLNGGVERWFEPVLDPVAAGPVPQAVFGACDRVFSRARGAASAWRVEVHQFRIEAGDGEGRPTPEGAHRDGVDWVFVMLVQRRNVLEGVTEIRRPDGTSLGRFTLAERGDAVLLDDHRVMHGVTPIRPIESGAPAFRDVLVVTFAAIGDVAPDAAAS